MWQQWVWGNDRVFLIIFVSACCQSFLHQDKKPDLTTVPNLCSSCQSYLCCPTSTRVQPSFLGGPLFFYHLNEGWTSRLWLSAFFELFLYLWVVHFRQNWLLYQTAPHHQPTLIVPQRCDPDRSAICLPVRAAGRGHLLRRARVGFRHMSNRVIGRAFSPRQLELISLGALKAIIVGFCGPSQFHADFSHHRDFLDSMPFANTSGSWHIVVFFLLNWKAWSFFERKKYFLQNRFQSHWLKLWIVFLLVCSCMWRVCDDFVSPCFKYHQVPQNMWVFLE